MTVFQLLRDRAAKGDDTAHLTLPDEQQQTGRVRFAPGAWDGVLTHHTHAGGDGDSVADLLALIRLAARGGVFADRRYARLAERAKDPDLLNLIDPLLQRIRRGRFDGSRLHGLAMRLATESSDRGPVKLGIALLGLFPVTLHREVLLTLGGHEEFALYAAVALGNGQDNPDDDLWALAKRLKGWGRIHLVERLAGTDRADILDWILRQGFRNDIMDEYLAHLAATRGNLLAALTADQVDDELLAAAGDLLTALLNSGPALDIHDYPDGPAVIRRYLGLMSERASEVGHLLVIGAIRDFVGEADLRTGCDQIISRPRWRALAVQALESTDALTSWRGERACAMLGISTLDTLLAQLRERPLESGKWFSAMRQADAGSVHRVLDLAVEVLPLDEIASGPADELGLGEQWAAHGCLDFIVQDLGDYPGAGWPLVAASLASPVVRNRNMAVRALSAWPREQWPPDAEMALRQAIESEPDDELKARMLETQN